MPPQLAVFIKINLYHIVMFVIVFTLSMYHFKVKLFIGKHRSLLVLISPLLQFFTLNVSPQIGTELFLGIH